MTAESYTTAIELARALNVSESAIYNWVRQGRIPHIRLGRSIRFTPEHRDHILQHGPAPKSAEGQA